MVDSLSRVAVIWLLTAAACGGSATDPGRTTTSPAPTTPTTSSATTTLPPAPDTGQDLEIHHLMEADAGGTFRAQGSTELRSTDGEGWRLIAVERFAGGPRRVAVATSRRGVDRMWEVYGLLSAKPVIDFEAEMLIAMTVAVSGSCPDLAFGGLVITDSRVYGNFEALHGTGICTDDANPVAFLFVADRQILPVLFDLSAEEELAVNAAQFDVVRVDQRDDAGLEVALWGSGQWWIAVEGTPPEPGTFNAVMWHDGPPNALLGSAESWEDFKGLLQGIPAHRVTLVEGFVATCDLDQCEECLGEECDLIDRLGDGCALEVDPVPFRDGIVWIRFDGTTCTITVEVSGGDIDP